MGQIDNFVKQHDELLDLAKQISNLLKAEALTSDAKAVSTLLSRLGGKLKMHLAMENKVLYPKLLKHDKPEVRQLTEKYMTEMDQIAKLFTAYRETWAGPSKIEADSKKFIEETSQIFQALGARIKAENTELYPLAAADA
jgi:hemerythrin-like domain-containing protein